MSKGKNDVATSSSSSSSSSSSNFQAIATSSNITRPNLTADEQRELNEQLFDAIYGEKENLNLIQDLINLGADVNAVDEDRYTPLHYAAQFGHTETAIALLQHGANPNAVNILHNTPLHYTVRPGHTETAIVLLQKNANPNAVNRWHNTPLHYAARNGHTETAMVLLQNGANPSTRNDYGHISSDGAKNDVIRSFLTKCINFQEGLKSIFDKMVESFSKTRAARNGKEEASASNSKTELDETLRAVRNKFEEDGIDLLLKNEGLLSPEFNPFDMALDNKGHSILHLMANEALKLGYGTEKDQYLELLAILAKESRSEKIKEIIKRATTISEVFRPEGKDTLVASVIEEIIVSYLYDNDTERTQTSQTLEEIGITKNVNQTIDNIEANIDDNLATALHLSANKGYLKVSDSSEAELNSSSQSSSSSSSSSAAKEYNGSSLSLISPATDQENRDLQAAINASLQDLERQPSAATAASAVSISSVITSNQATSPSLANKPKKPGITGSFLGTTFSRILDTIFYRNSAAEEENYPATNMAAAASSSPYSGSKEEEKSAPAARGNNPNNQIPATFVQNPSARINMSKGKNNNATSSSSSSSSSSSHYQAIATSSNITRPNLTADKQRELNKQLFDAVTKKTENLTLVKKLINQGADVNAVDEYYHSTPLHYAAENGHTETAIALLQNRANPNAVDKTRNTPLHFAAFNGHTKTVIVLLENHANPNAVDNYLSTPLHRVTQDGHTKTAIDLLRQNGADINALDVYIYTPAAERERTKTAIALLQKGASPNAMNKLGDTPLHRAASYGYTKIPTALLQNGANPSARNNNNKAASDLAINGDTKSFLINCINFQKELKSIFDKMEESFSKTQTAINGKEEVSASASNPQTDLVKTLEDTRNRFLEAVKDLALKNKNLFSPEFHPFNMALDDKGHSILHLMANEALKLGYGPKRNQYLGLLATLAKESGSEKIQEMINRATTISKELRPSVASDIEEIIVSYLHDNEFEREKEKAPTSQTNIDDNLATALHLAANKGYLIASNQPTSSSSSLANKPKKPGIMGRFFNAIFYRNSAAEEENYPATNMAAAASSSTYSGSKEEEKSAPAARYNNPDNQRPATFVQNPSANATSSKDQQNQR